MSEQLFEHYKNHADQSEPEIGYHSVIFDSVMPDDVLRELMAPVEAVEIERAAAGGIVSFYSSSTYDYELLKKVREWEKTYAAPLRAEKEAKDAAESKARFEEYYRSLDLRAEDGAIPAIQTRRVKPTLHGYCFQDDDRKWQYVFPED